MKGIGSMLHHLCGGSKEDPGKYAGKTVSAAEIKDDNLFITFEDGPKIVLSDEGQSCCESRYMTCDDNPSDLVGGKFVTIDVVDTEDRDLDYGSHDMVFVKVETDKASITLCTHNEHNGYYGGFALNIEEV